MTNPLQQCPSVWKEYNISGARACGRQFSNEGSCATTQYFAANQYSNVCGRIFGYQVASPDGFSSVENHEQNELGRRYMDGISITYRASHHHI